MKIADFLHEYQLDSPFADWNCADKPVAFSDIPVGESFSIVDNSGKLYGWGYNEYLRMETAGVFHKEDDTSIVALCTKYPTPKREIDPKMAKLPICIQILAD